MPTRRWGAALLAALLLTASAAAAQTMEPTPIPAPPKPDLQPMAYFLGTWNCTLHSSRRPTPRIYHETVTVGTDGRWITAKSVSLPISWFPYRTTEIDQFTYDPDTKRWIEVGWDTLGGYTFSVSPGWKGDTMLWTDLTFVPTRDMVSETPVTITRVSASRYTWSNAFRTGAGRTVRVSTACTKR